MASAAWSARFRTRFRSSSVYGRFGPVRKSVATPMTFPRHDIGTIITLPTFKRSRIGRYWGTVEAMYSADEVLAIKRDWPEAATRPVAPSPTACG